ncbi:MAG: fimbrial major subunit CsuA/B family protein [Gallionella sp.]|nr:fimbrial major subunit CsuA/B family protein [Gallionella sp.]
MNAQLFRSHTVAWLGILFSLSFSHFAQAAVLCSVTSPGFSAAYVTSNITTNVTATSFTVTCTKDAVGRRATSTISYQVTAGNGLQPTGTQNRAKKLTSFLNYSVSTVPTCATPWKGATVLPSIAASFVMAINTTVTNTYTFYGCIPPLQVATAPAGNYTDTVTMTIARLGGGGGRNRVTFTNGTFPVNIVAPATCALTTPPTNLAFAYTAFRPTAVLASASYSVTCSTLLPYTMALDATAGVVTGLNYTLALNTVATGGANPLASVGTGVAQSFFINGSMAARQAGTCTTALCTGAQVRTLTITY